MARGGPRLCALPAGRQLGDEIGAFIGIHTPFHDRDTVAITTARPLGIDLYRELRAPTQRHLGGQDGDTPPDVTEPRTVARDVTKALEAHTYPLAEHAFALFTVGDWRRAHDARTCTLAGALLRRHLPAI